MLSTSVAPWKRKLPLKPPGYQLSRPPPVTPAGFALPAVLDDNAASVNFAPGSSLIRLQAYNGRREMRMDWTTPTLVEICIGLEINGYLPAEF
jgi:coenzyme PQQ precursor peptide PqqA